MTTTKHEGKCCQKCKATQTVKSQDYGTLPVSHCINVTCDCHLKQSTELEEMKNIHSTLLLVFSGEPTYWKGLPPVIIDALAKAYQSGHTAGQAEEREKIIAIIKAIPMREKITSKEIAVGYIAGHADTKIDILSSLNKD